MDDRRDDSTPNRSSNQAGDWTDLHLWQIRFIRDILAALIVFLLFWLGYALRDVTIPLLVALLLAYLAEPAIRWTAAKRWIPFQRLGAVILFVTLFIIGILAVIAFVVPPTIKQVVQLVNDVESGSVRAKLVKLNEEYIPEGIQPDLLELVQLLPLGRMGEPDLEGGDPANAEPTTSEAASPGSAEPAGDEVGDDSTRSSEKPPSTGGPNRGLESVAASVKANSGVLVGIVRQGGSIAWSVVLELIAFGMLLFLIPFYFFFFSLWYPHVTDFIDSMIPERDRGRSRDLLLKMDAAVAGFVRGRILIAVIMSVMFVAGYFFVGVPYAILLGILAGIVSIVPYLGLVAIPIAIVLMFIGQLEMPEADRMAWWGVLLWPTVVYAVVSAIDGWILTPWIQGKSTNLDPVTIFVAILAGGSVLGIYGMLISIPVAACLKILLAEVVVPKLRELGSRPRAGEASS